MTRPTTAQLNAAYDQFNFWYDKAKKLDEELAKAEERIAELEFIRNSADKVQREFANELGCAGDNESILQAIEDLKQQSEPRTVTVKLPRPGFVTIFGERKAVYLKSDVDAAILAAGIEESR
ncbi:MAG: hypothetical protein P0Y63_16300 [Klebsiella huaxiensis]|uniref:hypothetical protein n=1 Tax=Klebsiella huaxiensis TaxID=2153354 RepID=UPI0026EDB1BF|nr:hypothetical protein [Klebsiella huaxiensis]WEJ86897.1 MAG: hypothetical protein P0Y63_16300 [Klebsiella huaxiensis]